MKPVWENMRKKAQSAFTLIELLVTIVIIGLLATLGYTAYSKVMSAADQAGCLSNLRNIGFALESYATDNEDYYPRSWDSSTNDTWIDTLVEGDYLHSGTRSAGNAANIFISPAAKIPVPSGFWGSTYTTHIYLFRGNDISVYPPGEPDLIKRVSIPKPSEKILIANGPQANGGLWAYSSFWEPWQMRPSYQASSSLMNDFIPVDQSSNVDSGAAGGNLRYLHDNNTATNALMADGHVESFKIGTIRYRNVIVNQ